MRYLLLAVLLGAHSAPAWARAGGGGGGGGGGGCFPAGTSITTAAGGIPIEKIKPGDTVLAFAEDGVVQARVRNFYEKKDRLLVIRTAKGRLTATSEHPLMTRSGFTEVRDLKKGMEVGVLEDGKRVWTRIKSIKPGGVAPVYNLEVDPPHTFIADGFIVHNKGGFGGSYSRSYSGGRYGRRSYGLIDLIFIGLAVLVVFFKNLFSGAWSWGRGGNGSASGGWASPSKKTPPLLANGPVATRAEKVMEIIRSLARRDPDFEPNGLENLARNTFLRVQAAWQARDYSALAGAMMPNLHASHSAKVAALRAQGHRNMMEAVQVYHVDFVHVRRPEQKEGRAFTALITAAAKDYTIDESTGSLVSGSREPASFQEFWTFHQLNGAWALARIDQIGDLDFLNAPNLPAEPEKAGAFPRAAAGTFAPAAAGAALGAAAGDFAGAAAAVPAAAGLDFAAAAAALQPPQQQPPREEEGAMNRQKMEIAATLAFESVYEAWASNDSSRLSADFVSAEALAKLKRVMEDRKAEGLTFQFASLFTRRAEVVLALPAAKSRLHLDEFTARITATAVRAMLRNGKTLHRDAAPQPFTEYWVFGRQNKSWKLRDILPRMDQESEDRSQDGAPGPAQIEWYWQS